MQTATQLNNKSTVRPMKQSETKQNKAVKLSNALEIKQAQTQQVLNILQKTWRQKINFINKNKHHEIYHGLSAKYARELLGFIEGLIFTATLINDDELLADLIFLRNFVFLLHC